MTERLNQGLGKRSPEQAEQKKLDQQKRSATEQLTSTRMNMDVRNSFVDCAGIASDVGSLGALERLPTYADYFYNLYEKHTPENAQEMVMHVLGESDPDAVNEFNKVVREFNTDLDRIKKEDDRNALIRFYNQLDRIVLGPDHLEIPELTK